MDTKNNLVLQIPFASMKDLGYPHSVTFNSVDNSVIPDSQPVQNWISTTKPFYISTRSLVVWVFF